MESISQMLPWELLLEYTQAASEIAVECVVDFEESRTRWSSGAHSVGAEMVGFQGFPQVASGTTERNSSWQNSKSLTN